MIEPPLICTWFLKYLAWKIKFDELDFLWISKWIFAGYTGSKNQICRTWFFKQHISKIKCKSTGDDSQVQKSNRLSWILTFFKYKHQILGLKIEELHKNVCNTNSSKPSKNGLKKIQNRVAQVGHLFSYCVFFHQNHRLIEY